MGTLHRPRLPWQQQPLRTIMVRFRDGTDRKAELECGHTQSLRGILDNAKSMRCDACPPDERLRPPKTHQQPLRTITGRYANRMTTWAVLDCGHHEPAAGLDQATALRCQQCSPVRRQVAP